MKTQHGLALILIVGLLLSGCTTGLIYTHTVRPLDLNQDNTPTAEKVGQSDIRYLNIPLIARGQLSFLWNSNAIGDIARKNGFETVYYADIEVLSILTIWNQYTVHIYGD